MINYWPSAIFNLLKRNLNTTKKNGIIDGYFIDGFKNRL
jgi:hypothetical protein